MRINRTGVVAGLCLLAPATAGPAAENAFANRVKVALTIRALDAELPAVEAMVRPKGLDVDRSVPWLPARDSDEDSPAVEFTTAPSKAIGLLLEVDGSNDLPKLAERLQALARKDDKLGRPPRVKVIWGSALEFEGVVESVGVKYTLFNADGNPVRAVVSLKLREAQRAGVRKCQVDADCAQGQACVNSLCAPR